MCSLMKDRIFPLANMHCCEKSIKKQQTAARVLYPEAIPLAVFLSFLQDYYFVIDIPLDISDDVSDSGLGNADGLPVSNTLHVIYRIVYGV